MKRLLSTVVLSSLVPLTVQAAQPKPADHSFRQTAPTVGAPRSVAVPQPQVFQLANGIEVLLIERHELPTVTMELLMPGGTLLDPAGQEGLATTCMGLLTEGTEQLDKIAYHEALADIAAEVNGFAASDQHGLSLQTLARHLEPALDLWVGALLRPGLRQTDMDRLIKRRLAALAQSKGNPAHIAGRLLPSVAWGPEHPYGRVVTQQSLEAQKLSSCQQFVQQLSPQGARLFVVGDITRQQIETAVGKRLEGWKAKAPDLPALGERKNRNGKVFFVDVPGAEQAVVLVTHAGPKRTEADYDPTAMMATVLGGGFTSRLNMNLREQKGWAYGAGGGFSYNRTGGTFTASANVRSDAAGGAVSEILREMKLLQKDGAQADELQREKDGAILALPARWSTGRSVLGTYQTLVYFGLPLDDYATYVPRVQALTQAQILAAAQKHLRPDGAQVLVVGDGKKVRPQLDKLVAEKVVSGEIVTLDADGRVVAPAGAGKPVAGKP